MSLSKSLSDQLEIWGLENDFTIFEDGSIGFILKLEPRDITCKPDEDVNQFAELLSRFLNGLPEDCDIQFIQEITGGNNSILKKHKSLGVSCDKSLVNALTDSRVAKYTDMDQQNEVPVYSVLLLVRRPLASALNPVPNIFSKENKFEQVAEDRFRSELTVTACVRDNIISDLNVLNLNPEIVQSESVAAMMYKQWNPERKVDYHSYDPNDIRDSLLFTDLSVSSSGFSLGETHFRMVSLKLLPDHTTASISSTLLELPFDSKLFLSIHIPKQVKELESLQTQRRLAFSMVHGKQGVSDLESEAKFQDIEALLEELISQNEKVFRVSLNVLLKSQNPSDLDQQVAQTLTTIRSMAGAEAMEETIAAFDVFSELSLPNTRARERAKRMKTSNVRDLLPVFGPWKGHSQPSILLRTRIGSLVGFNPFDRNLTNYNQIVSGGSGSGKSFLTNILLLQMLKEDPKVFIVDIGGSYKKICECLDGQYIPLGVDGGLSINPFDLLPDEQVPSNHKIKFLLGLIELMTKEDDAERLPRLHRAEIEEAICKVYDLKRNPVLSDLRNLLLEHENVEIRKYGRILTSWCGNTPYGRFLDRETTISFEKPIVSFDLKGMETHPDLQAATLFLITDYVWREVQRDRSSKKFLVFDECWKLLENDAGATFIAEVFRTFRKYHASAIAISQNIDDFAKSKISGAILSNSATKWILMQKGADQNRLQEVLQLNDTEKELIGSLHQERGKYSEAFLIAQDERALVRIESTPMEYWVATTDPKDLALMENHGAAPVDQVIQRLADKFPNGVSYSIFTKDRELLK